MDLYSLKQWTFILRRKVKKGSLLTLGARETHTFYEEPYGKNQSIALPPNGYIFITVEDIGPKFCKCSFTNNRTLKKTEFYMLYEDLTNATASSIILLAALLFFPFVLYNLFSGFYFKKGDS